MHTIYRIFKDFQDWNLSDALAVISRGERTPPLHGPQHPLQEEE